MHFQIMEWAAAKNKVTLFGKSWKREKKKYRKLNRWIETNTHTFEYTQTVSGRKTGGSDPCLQRDHLVTMYIPTIFTF